MHSVWAAALTDHQLVKIDHSKLNNEMVHDVVANDYDRLWIDTKSNPLRFYGYYVDEISEISISKERASRNPT
ncbi:hypothetical protein ACFO4O_00995 [Glaciecola siphonariae]|uniref:Uncharacterized protein n=1 Tax=Glaciecola siphonariae TaxID=521012 RepID=A0ABV9LQF0_9ALTE